MEPSAARQLATWFFSSWATWGEAPPGTLVFPDQHGRTSQWAPTPRFWGGSGSIGQASSDDHAPDDTDVAVVGKADSKGSKKGLDPKNEQ